MAASSAWMLFWSAPRQIEIVHRTNAPVVPSAPIEAPSEAMRNPGLASATTKPSHHVIALRSSRSSTTAVAMQRPPRSGPCRWTKLSNRGAAFLPSRRGVLQASRVNSQDRGCIHAPICLQSAVERPTTVEGGMAEKRWGDEPYFGLGTDWDPDWLLTERQLELRDLLIELCEKEIRANAKISDDTLTYPRRNLELLGEHGFLGLTVTEEHGGLGQNHVAYAMTCETIARYGCASTAMCYVMHMSAVQAIMLRPTDALIDRYIRPLNSGKIGTLSYSDPETGSHFWYPISSGAERANGGYKVRKKASWTTSGGFADFYVIQTTSPDFKGYDDLSVWVIDGEHVKSQPSLWDALGLRGNQSGPIEIDNIEIPADQIVGPIGDGAASNDEAV